MEPNYTTPDTSVTGPVKKPDGQAWTDYRINQIVPVIFSGHGYNEKKVTDNPTDALDVTNRRYVNLNGSVAGRPNSSVATVGQFYLSTDTNIPMWYTTAGWRNGVGSIVAGA